FRYRLTRSGVSVALPPPKWLWTSTAGNAGLVISVVLLMSMERGFQSRNFNSLMSLFSWARATHAIRNGSVKMGAINRAMACLGVELGLQAQSRFLRRLHLSFGE